MTILETFAVKSNQAGIMKQQITNIINFIRGVEPREKVDLLLPVKEQLKLLQKFDLTGTFLMQYDALINNDFVDLLSLYSEIIEIGVWLEIVEPLCNEAGITWRGRPGYSWDHYAHVGFTVGYTKDERIALVDVVMEKFKSVWGNYSTSVGSWIIDAFTLQYLSERYHIVASCNCKDQWGTDGYTLWGGYYSQAYYPSKSNVLCPAKTLNSQIPVPVFRMLGSDPIYQYDLGLDTVSGSSDCQKVVTLEPVYGGPSGGGGNPEWVDWFFRENFNGTCLSFGYAQVGQENSFGWDHMKDGLNYQFEKLKKLSDEGIITVQTLTQTGKWFKENFAYTPASATAALRDWKNKEHRSIWYNCINYRINFLCEAKKFRVRDLHRFDERYQERYRDEVCNIPLLIFDNLPLMDGNRWSGHGTLAGIYPFDPYGLDVEFDTIDVKENGENLSIHWTTSAGVISCECSPDKLEWKFPVYGYSLNFKFDVCSLSAQINTNGCQIDYNYRGFEYSIIVSETFVSVTDVDNVRNLYIKASGTELKMEFR